MNNLFISIADMVDIGDPEKITYREINNSKSHNYSVGSLVELDSGCRLFVARHTRDCDGTPLYNLTHEAQGQDPLNQQLWINGISEYSIIKTVRAVKWKDVNFQNKQEIKY